MAELTLSEIHGALAYFSDEMKALTGNVPDVSFDVRPQGERYLAFCYPLGLGRARDMKSILEKGDDARTVLDDLRRSTLAAIEKSGDLVVRKMAEAIIRITYDCGECTDAALRGESFSQEEINKLGTSACAIASEMASKGPFEITSMAGANAA